MYIEGLKCIAAYQGYSPDDIDTMLDSGISPDETVWVMITFGFVLKKLMI